MKYYYIRRGVKFNLHGNSKNFYINNITEIVLPKACNEVSIHSSNLETFIISCSAKFKSDSRIFHNTIETLIIEHTHQFLDIHSCKINNMKIVGKVENLVLDKNKIENFEIKGKVFNMSCNVMLKGIERYFNKIENLVLIN